MEQFLEGLVAATSGQIQGRLAGEQQRRQIEAQQAQQKSQQFVEALHAFETGRGIEAAQNEREQGYDQLLGSFYPDMDTDSKAQLRQFLLDRGHLRAFAPSQFGPEQFRDLPGNPLGGAPAMPTPAAPAQHPLASAAAGPAASPTAAAPGALPAPAAPTRGRTINAPGVGTLTFSSFNREAATQLQKAVHDRLALLQNATPADEEDRKKIAAAVRSAPPVINDEAAFEKAMRFLDATAAAVPGSAANARAEMNRALETDRKSLADRVAALPRKPVANAVVELPALLDAEDALTKRLGARGQGMGMLGLYRAPITAIRSAQAAGNIQEAARLAAVTVRQMAVGQTPEQVEKERRDLIRDLPRWANVEPEAQHVILDELAHLNELTGREVEVPAGIIPRLAPDVRQRLAMQQQRIRLEGQRVEIDRARLILQRDNAAAQRQMERERNQLARQKFAEARRQAGAGTTKMNPVDQRLWDEHAKILGSTKRNKFSGSITGAIYPDEQRIRAIKVLRGLTIKYDSDPSLIDDPLGKLSVPVEGQSFGAPQQQPGGPPMLTNPQTGAVTPPGNLSVASKGFTPAPVTPRRKLAPKENQGIRSTTGLDAHPMDDESRFGAQAGKAGRLPASLEDTQRALSWIAEAQATHEGVEARSRRLPDEASRRLFWRTQQWALAGGKLPPAVRSAPSSRLPGGMGARSVPTPAAKTAQPVTAGSVRTMDPNDLDALEKRLRAEQAALKGGK
jgi:hypothetical protein